MTSTWKPHQNTPRSTKRSGFWPDEAHCCPRLQLQQQGAAQQAQQQAQQQGSGDGADDWGQQQQEPGLADLATQPAFMRYLQV